MLRCDLIDSLSGVFDLERLMTRIIYADAVCENVTVQSNRLILWLHHDEVERVTRKTATA